MLNSYYIAELPLKTFHPFSFPGGEAEVPTFSSGGQWVGGTQIPLRDAKILQGIWIWKLAICDEVFYKKYNVNCIFHPFLGGRAKNRGYISSQKNPGGTQKYLVCGQDPSKS